MEGLSQTRTDKTPTHRSEWAIRHDHFNASLQQYVPMATNEASPGIWENCTTFVKARLHMRFFMRFRCDFDAILRTKPAPANPARVFSRVTLRQNTTKLAEIGMKGVLKQYVITFFPIHTMLREKSIRAG